MGMVNQKQLKELIDYCPDTGILRWIHKSRKGGFPAWREIKCLDAYGYIQVIISGNVYRGHRLAWLYMTGEIPKHVYHINHDRADNRWVNLRGSINHQNRQKQRNNKSGFVGVSFYKRVGKWVAYINVNGKRVGLGYFDKKEDAILARKAASNCSPT